MLNLSQALAALVLAAGIAVGFAAEPAQRPNIVYILCDDLGYGDVHCLNPDGKIPTPQMDRVAAGGMVFTDAHSSSAVCTPSRYSILTGRYNWRSSIKRGVLNGFSPTLIEKGRPTIASFLREQGYATACLGKWHLGMNWPQNDGSPPGSSANPKKVSYTEPIEGGPRTAGFGYFYGISASLDMPPFVYIENERVTEIPTVEKEWVRKGPAAKSFEAVDVLPELERKAVVYIEEQASQAKAGHPFFLYLPLTSPHTPIAPIAKWQEKSGLNGYGDFVMQTDATIGGVLDALERRDVATNTLLIVTSDNGCSPAAGYPVLLKKGHNPSYHFRGTKADIFEGGHRIPFMVRWPGHVKAGSRTDELVCQVDLFATCADILGKQLPDDAAEDSVSILPALLGRAQRPVREAVVHSSINGSFSIREGKWKLELCLDSGGWSKPQPDSKESAGLPKTQLYDLSRDISETNNLEARFPEVTVRLTKLLEKYIAEGRSTPGPPQSNTGRVELHPRSPKVLERGPSPTKMG